MAYQLTCDLPVDDRLIEGLDIEWQRFAAAGTWWTGAERVAIAAEARAARSCRRCAERNAALSPEGHPHAANGPLTAAAVDAIHRTSTDSGRLSARWAEQVSSAGVTPEQLVEMAAVVAILTIGDTLARATGATASELPAGRPGEPSRQRPSGLETESAWVPVVHPDRAEGTMKESFEGARQAVGYVFNIGRALTLVPAEFEGFRRAFMPTYPSQYDRPAGELNRSQIEFLAAAVSAANDCFY